MNAKKALERLKAGNKNYINAALTERNETLAQRIAQTANGQSPYAVILTCSDSRVIPEWVFDSDIGELFVIRNAGNVVNEDVLASAEYAVTFLEVPLILVLGHSRCGAVNGAYHGIGAGHLPATLAKVRPAVRDIIEGSAVTSAPQETLDRISERNVHHSMKALRDQSECLRSEVERGKVEIQGGLYRVEDGRVQFEQ